MNKYAYNFDYIMHDFMIRSFKPHFKTGNALELGSFEGAFTEKLLKHFDDITCIEADVGAIDIASLKSSIPRIYCATIEDATPPRKYDNIFMTHVLEHIDNPSAVLKKINQEWLSDNGRLFIAVPNARALSRQLAVQMGIIPFETAVTQSEASHGHKRTYSFSSLESHVKSSGLKIQFTEGIFLKPFANFQIDRLLDDGILTQSHLEGFYKLGKQYPYLCSSIFCLCQKNT